MRPIKIKRIYLVGKCGAPGGNCKNIRCLRYKACQLVHNKQTFDIVRDK